MHAEEKAAFGKTASADFASARYKFEDAEDTIRRMGDVFLISDCQKIFKYSEIHDFFLLQNHYNES